MSKTRISLLIELLKSFSSKELEVFTKFVESAYFNEDEKLIILLKKIKRYALKAEKFTEDLQLKVYEDTFCDKPLKQKELTKKQSVFLKNKQHKLLRLAEQFLMIENLKEKETVQMELLYKPLIERNQINLYQRHLKSDTKKLAEEDKRGIEHYEKQLKLQVEILNYTSIHGLLYKEDNFNELQYCLDINYLIKKLMHFLVQITLKDQYKNKTYIFSSLDEISNLLAISKYKKNPLVQIYLSNIKLVEQKNDESFKNLLAILDFNQNNLPAKFLKIFYTNLTNYCSTQIKKGNTEYYKNMFDIYKTMQQNNLLIIDNLMDIGLLKNIITISCTIKEFEWAREILEKYKKFIPIKIREGVYFYNKGVIEFNKDSYSLAQDWFLKVGKINDTYEMGLRIFMLQCIFEVEFDYNEATKQSFESAKQFFNRNTNLSSINKTSYINFISIFANLYKYKHRATNTTLIKIKEKLHKMDVIHKKKWLCNKIEEMQ